MAHLGDTMNPMSSPSVGGQMIGPMKSMTGPGTGLGLGSGALEFKKWGDTTSKIGENSRIFIGNVDFKNTSCDNIEKRFSSYGLIKGIDIHPSGFAFVQFSKDEDAQKACQGENGTQFTGRRIEVRMFDKNKFNVNKNQAKKNRNRNRSRSPLVRGPPQYGAVPPPPAGPTGTRHGAPLPPSSYFDYYPDEPPVGYGPPPPSSPVNDAEIIVVNKEQWAYAEIIENRIRHEIGMEYVDMLFLHTPSSLNATLNDLFERQTFYAIVLTPANEQHRSLTLHILHNQIEHRNMLLDDAIALIRSDFHSILTSRGIPIPPIPAEQQLSTTQQQSSSANSSYANPNSNGNGNGTSELSSSSNKERDKLPGEISYLLKTVIQEEGPRFLSLSQIDQIIDYFQREREKLTGLIAGKKPEEQSSNSSSDELFKNPQVKATLTSMLQIGHLDNLNSLIKENSGSLNSSVTQNNDSLTQLIKNVRTQSYGQLSEGQVSNSGPNPGQTPSHLLLGVEIPNQQQTQQHSQQNYRGQSSTGSNPGTYNTSKFY